MANRSITVTLRANVQDFKSQFDAATRAAEETAKATEQSAKRADTAMGQMVQSAQTNRQAWDQAGGTLTAFGAAALGGLGLATKAAMDWESSWTGVLKTVEGTPAQLNAVEEGLRGLARELPASHAEIAAVAEAAGQLGIETDSVVEFTETMIALGVSTNLSAEEAATGLARFSNIMGTSQDDFDRLGSAMVGLGNNYATTEGEILAMGLRLAGTSNQIGLTEGEVLGLATAMSSVGIEAQAGGTAMSMGMRKINDAVEEGGDSLAGFAEVAGMTSDEFSRLWQEDSAAGLEVFVQGLARVSAEGGNVSQVLGDLGIKGIRESDTFLRLAGSADILGDALATGNREFEQNIALVDEATKFYETAESRIAIAGNAIVDAGIEIGGVVLPALADVADRVADVAGGFADLPGPVQGAVGALGGIAGAGALAAGSFLLIFPRVMDTVGAFKTLRQDMPGVASGLSKIGRVAGVAAAGIAVLNIAGSVTESFRDGAEQAELLAAQLLNAAQAGDITAESINNLVSSTVPFGVSVHGVGDALDLVDTDPVSAGIEGLTKTLLGVPTTVDVATESLSSLDGALSQLVSGGQLDEFGNAFAAAVEDAEQYGHTAEDLVERLPGLKEVLTPIATEMGIQATNANLAKLALEGLDPAVVAAASGMEEGAGAAWGLAEGMEGAAEATQSVAEAAEEAITAMSDLASEFINAERSAMDYADALDEANDLIKENGQAWEDGTEAGDDNKRMLLDLADQAWATADALSADNKSGTFLEGAREDLIDVATEMIGSREEAEKYVDQLLGTPDEIETIVKLEADAAREEWDALWDDLGYHPPLLIDPEVDPDGKLPQFTGLIDTIPPETNTDVNVETDEAAEKAWGFQGVIEGATEDQDVNVGAEIEPAMSEVARLESLVMASGGSVTINGETYDAETSLTEIMRLINESDGTVTINGEDYPAEDALNEILRQIDAGDGTVTIDGNNAPATSATDAAERYANEGHGTMMIGGDPSDAFGAVGRATSHANRSRGSISVSALTSAANAAINHAARRRFATIQVNYSGVRNNLMAGAGRAMGGPINGPGTGTSDSVPIMASNGEHMWTAAEVSRAGGHQAMYHLRQQIMAGAKSLHLATGGGVENGSVAPVQSSPVYQQARAQNVSASVDTGQIASAVNAAMSSWQPMVKIGRQTLYGEMVSAGREEARR